MDNFPYPAILLSCYFFFPSAVPTGDFFINSLGLEGGARADKLVNCRISVESNR